MSYTTIDITEVGPPEYPLIAVLRDSIFGEFRHRFSATFEQQIDGRRDVLALMAHLEGNPVGYKVGFQDRPGRYLSSTGGVLRDYRGQGVGRRMQEWQHGWLRARGYQSVAFDSFNKFRPMLQFGLSSGFVPTGIRVQTAQEASIHFAKDLTRPDPAPRAKEGRADVRVESVGPNFHGMVAQVATDAGRATTEADIDRAMAGPDALALVAFAGGRPVGFALGLGDAHDRGVYRSAAGGVLPQWRGRGVGTALLGHQVRAAAGMGYPTVRRRAMNEDVPLIRAGLAAGFDLTGIMFDTRGAGAAALMEARSDRTH